MPTTLPRRAALPARTLDFADLAIPMLRFYLVIAMAIAIILAIEHHLGLFAGTTFIDAIMQSTGSDSPYLLVGP